nr:MFS transporter [Novosphingopyxis iocasae]
MNNDAAPARNPEATPGYFGWRVLLGAAVGLAFSPGPVSLLLIGAYAPVYAQRYGWSFGAIMFSLTILNLATIVAAPFAGRLIDRFGARTLLFPSLIAMALCLLAIGYGVTSLPALYAVCALFGFSTVGAQSLTYNKLLTGWFDANRGLVLGIASSGLGLGYSILPLIIGFGMAAYGPGGTTLLLAAIILLLPLVVNLFVAHPRPDREAKGNEARSDPVGRTLRQAVTTRYFWLLAIAIFLVSIIATGIVPQFANVSKDLSFTTAQAATIASVFGIATLIGRLVVGWLFDRFFAPRVTSIIFFAAALGYALAAWTVFGGLGWTGLLIAGILMGLGFGAESDLIGYLASRYWGYRHFGAIYGSLLSIFILGAATGPLLYGTMRDIAQSYGPVFILCALLGTTASGLMLLLPRFPTAEELHDPVPVRTPGLVPAANESNIR